MIKVWPTSENVLKHVKHPNGTKLRGMTEPTMWPEDQFTFRRLADGDVTQEPPKQAEAPVAEAAAEKPRKPEPSVKS